MINYNEYLKYESEFSQKSILQKYNTGENIIDIYIKNELFYKMFIVDGKLHNENGPAIIKYNNGYVEHETYYIDGIINKKGVYYKRYFINSNSVRLIRYANDNIYVYVYFCADGTCSSIQYYKDEKIPHREDGPAKIFYYNKNDPFLENHSELYFIDGKLHRDNGPALIEYYVNDSVKSEYYYKYGNQHREDGSAVIKYNENGSVKEKAFYVNGNRIKIDKFSKLSKEQFIVKIKSEKSKKNLHEYKLVNNYYFKGDKYLMELIDSMLLINMLK